jgi:Gly-Xaa carboxypeptidase
MVLNRHFQQQPVFHPETRPDITTKNLAIFDTDAFRDEVAARLTGSVQIPTVTYDSMGHVGEDARWDIFYEHSKYLQKTFPRM